VDDGAVLGNGSTDEEVPSPELVAAWLALGRTAPTRSPWWAAQWLVDGQDGEALRALAGLNDRDVFAISDLLPVALRQMGITPPVSVADATTVIFDDLARRCLQGRLGERQLAQAVEDVARRTDYCADVLDLPLAGVYGVDDAWSGQWEQSREELAQAVQALCRDQIRSTET
jgi:hypothetical protein